MANLLRKLSTCCLCSLGHDSDSSESEIDNTTILPHRRPYEAPKSILKKGGAVATEAAGNDDNTAVTSAQGVPKWQPLNNQITSCHPPGSKVFRPDLDNPRKDPYHQPSGNDESTLIIEQGSNFPAVASAPDPEDSENQSSLGNILPEDLVTDQPRSASPRNAPSCPPPPPKSIPSKPHQGTNLPLPAQALQSAQTPPTALPQWSFQLHPGSATTAAAYAAPKASTTAPPTPSMTVREVGAPIPDIPEETV
ncbi:uncharacterized protein DFL_000039 [Arthrobotrys flagrans]|uniref:Uncharacterized protein n=1 Tax=Arthrobotrys flagrans TaxID=97331 RepID=A0A437ACL7_ARTFL|nr:hypothetical protein DFL_000039 [Arthrobotrys flagrans]